MTVNPKSEGMLEVKIYCTDPQSAEVRQLLTLLADADRRIPAQQPDAQLLLSPTEVLYGEFVGRGVFLYTADAVLPTSLTLAQLEQDYSGFFRCSKSMVVNLNRIRRLKSEVSGRILATLVNDECILISRHYAAALRRALSGSNTEK